ncbi:hypothetical protein ASD76_08290 [Altererythrobacter sp. Root672]|nr:hypothetical protein ASD76_08290 [Altererythrobacter sp. Root672]
MRSRSSTRSTSAFARLGKQAFARRFLFLDVMVDLFAQDLHLGVVELVLRPTLHDVIDQDFCAIVLDVGLAEQIVVDLALQRRVENLFLDRRVNLELGADLLGDRLLAPIAAGIFVLGEQVLTLR